MSTSLRQLLCSPGNAAPELFRSERFPSHHCDHGAAAPTTAKRSCELETRCVLRSWEELPTHQPPEQHTSFLSHFLCCNSLVSFFVLPKSKPSCGQGSTRPPVTSVLWEVFPAEGGPDPARGLARAPYCSAVLSCGNHARRGVCWSDGQDPSHARGWTHSPFKTAHSPGFPSGSTCHGFSDELFQ